MVFRPDKYGARDAEKKDRRAAKKLCAEVYAVFPPEVRENIYRFLLPPILAGTGNCVSIFRPDEKAEKPSYKDDRPDRPYRHLDERFLGKAVAQELAAYCYRKLEFEFSVSLRGTPIAECRLSTWLKGVDRNGLLRSDHVMHVRMPRLNGWNRLIFDPNGVPFEGLKSRAILTLSYTCNRTDEKCLFGWLRDMETEFSALISAGYRVRLERDHALYSEDVRPNEAPKLLLPRFYVELKKLPMTEEEWCKARVQLPELPRYQKQSHGLYKTRYEELDQIKRFLACPRKVVLPSRHLQQGSGCWEG